MAFRAHERSQVPARGFPHHRHSVALHDGAHVQSSVVGHVGQDVDDGDKGHGNSNGQRKIPRKMRRCVVSALVLAAYSDWQ